MINETADLHFSVEFQCVECARRFPHDTDDEIYLFYKVGFQFVWITECCGAYVILGNVLLK